MKSFEEFLIEKIIYEHDSEQYHWAYSNIKQENIYSLKQLCAISNNPQFLSLLEMKQKFFEEWVHGTVDGASYNKSHEWEGNKKFAKKYSTTFDPNFILWGTKSSFVLTDIDEKYIAHIYFDVVDRVSTHKAIQITDGYSDIRGAYKKLLYGILVSSDYSMIFGDSTMSEQAKKAWSKFLVDPTFKPYVYTNGVLEDYADQEVFSEDRSLSNVLIGISLKSGTKELVESRSDILSKRIGNAYGIYEILTKLYGDDNEII